METKKYNKLALIGFIVGPVSIVLIVIVAEIATNLLGISPDEFATDFFFAFLIYGAIQLAMFLVSVSLAAVSLFTIKENQKGKGLAIITIVFPIVSFIVSRLLNRIFY